MTEGASMSDGLSEAQRRALAARLAAAEGALLVLAADTRLALRQSPADAPSFAEILQTVEAFSAACDGLFDVFALPAMLRDRRLPVAEQVGRLAAALEDVQGPERAPAAPDAVARTALADLRLAVSTLEQTAQGMQPVRRWWERPSSAE